MRTIKLKRDSWLENGKRVFSEDFYNEEAGRFGEEILCGYRLFQLFNMPKKVEEIWVNIRKSPKKGWYKAKFIPCPDDSRTWPALEMDGKTYTAFYEVEDIMHDNDINYGDDFYFTIEYKD